MDRLENGAALAAQKTTTKRKTEFGGIAVFCVSQSDRSSLRTRDSSSVKHTSSARSDSASVAHKRLFQGDEEKRQCTRSSAAENIYIYISVLILARSLEP